ncbi:MAG: hypothetical protein AABX30_01735 [Nanoarchaeota archaeon]
MAKKCIYCKIEIPEEHVIDFCEKCGIGVFGEKLFQTIVSNMEDARERGDLLHTPSDGFSNCSNRVSGGKLFFKG